MPKNYIIIDDPLEDCGPVDREALKESIRWLNERFKGRIFSTRTVIIDDPDFTNKVIALLNQV